MSTPDPSSNQNRTGSVPPGDPELITLHAVIDLIEGYAATVDSHGALDVDPYRAAKQAAKEILTAVKALAKGGDAT